MFGTVTGRVVGAGLRSGAALINPTNLASMVALGAGMFAYRHYTGATFSQMGQGINEFFLGKIDDEQRARVAVGQQIGGNDSTQMFIARVGISDDIRKAAELMLPNQLNEELQKTAYREEYPVVEHIELLVRAFQRGLNTEWRESDGRERIRNFWKGVNNAARGGNMEKGTFR